MQFCAFPAAFIIVLSIKRCMEEKGEEKNIDLFETGAASQMVLSKVVGRKKNMKTGISICQCEAGNTVGETKIAQPALL
jgi:hypothetical protein